MQPPQRKGGAEVQALHALPDEATAPRQARSLDTIWRTWGVTYIIPPKKPAGDLAAGYLYRLHAAPPSTQNDAQYGWFNATGCAASASVRPSSNRAS